MTMEIRTMFHGMGSVGSDMVYEADVEKVNVSGREEQLKSESAEHK